MLFGGWGGGVSIMPCYWAQDEPQGCFSLLKALEHSIKCMVEREREIQTQREKKRDRLRKRDRETDRILVKLQSHYR